LQYHSDGGPNVRVEDRMDSRETARERPGRREAEGRGRRSARPRAPDPEAEPPPRS